MAKRRSAQLDPEFDAEGFERFRDSVLNRFVAVEVGYGPRFRDLEDPEARVAVALRARARWAGKDDFALALVEPSRAVDPGAEG